MQTFFHLMRTSHAFNIKQPRELFQFTEEVKEHILHLIAQTEALHELVLHFVDKVNADPDEGTRKGQ